MTKLIDEIQSEYQSATSKFPHFNTPHEGYAVILEEVDELWDEIKKVKYPLLDRECDALKKECIQVAAMCIKFIQSFDNYKKLNVK